MSDEARNQLEVEIGRTKDTERMLKHLASAIEHGPSQTRGETYQSDAIEALEHGAEIVGARVRNLRHVARIYDARVAEEVPEPRA